MGFLQFIIRNESMKIDPVGIYSPRVFLLACAACFGGMLFGFDIGAIGGVITMPLFEKSFGINPNDKIQQANLSANIVSVMQAGAFAGALGASPIADRYGRKPGLLIASLVSVIGVILQASSSGILGVMYTGRFIAGLGLGAATMLTPTYISENAPRAIRGLLTGFYQLFETAGAMIAFWINYGSLINNKGNATWIVPLAMQGIPAVLLFIGMLLCTESPRFLAKQDKWEEAHRILAQIRNLPLDHTYVQVELQEMGAQLERERELFADSNFWTLQKETWLVPGNRKRAIISIALMVGQQMTGTNAVNYYAPQIFTNLGITGNANGLFATGVYGIVKMVGCALFLVFCADSLGRKKSLLWTAIGMGIAMYYIGFYVRFDPPVKDAPVPPAGYVALVMVYLFAAFFQFGWGPVCWIYVSEIPSARLRGLNVAMAAATQWLFNFVVARTTPNMLATVGSHGYGTYFLFGSFCFAMFVLTWFFIPETKGLSLERMDELFGVSELKEVADPGMAAVASGEKDTPVYVERV